MAGIMKMLCIRMNILSYRNNIELFLPCNMAAMQNLNYPFDYLLIQWVTNRAHNRSFAGYDHMVQNSPYWNANCALGHPKQRRFKLE